MLNLVWWILGGRIVLAGLHFAIKWIVYSTLPNDSMFADYYSEQAAFAFFNWALARFNDIGDPYVRLAVAGALFIPELLIWPIIAIMDIIMAAKYIGKHTII